MNQVQAIKEHLESGKGITSMQAIKLYGCTRLSAKIFILRKRGMNISTIEHETVNRYGHKTSYLEYRKARDYGNKDGAEEKVES